MTRQSVPILQRSNARKMRQEMTDADRKLWGKLRAHRLMGLGFRRQLPIGKYIVDFACPKHKLIIEVDGSGHSEQQQMDYDTRRTTYLRNQGWHVIRMWNGEVLMSIQDACTHIVAILQQRGVHFDAR